MRGNSKYRGIIEVDEVLLTPRLLMLSHTNMLRRESVYIPTDRHNTHVLNRTKATIFIAGSGAGVRKEKQMRGTRRAHIKGRARQTEREWGVGGAPDERGSKKECKCEKTASLVFNI